MNFFFVLTIDRRNFNGIGSASREPHGLNTVINNNIGVFCGSLGLPIFLATISFDVQQFYSPS